MFSQYGTSITKKPLFDIAIAKTSVNGTIDNIQFPLFLGIANANAIAQCERTLTIRESKSVSEEHILLRRYI